MPIALSGYYSRSDAQIAAGYERLLFRATKGLQSAELNEIQEITYDRLERIADAIWRDGSVLEGTEPAITLPGGSTFCPASLVYADGAVRTVPAATITIPTTGMVRIGVWLEVTEVTDVDDTTLRGPAVGTRNYNTAGAGRLQVTPQWKTDQDAVEPFYPVYTVVDGALFNQTPPLDNSFINLVARYDREANGNYIANGLNVTALANGIYSIAEGTGNLEGYKIDKGTTTRINWPDNPDLETVLNEPDNYVDGSTPVQLNRTPVSSITNVAATLEKTVTLQRGGTPDGQDLLPDASVTVIVSISGYSETTDYILNGDYVDWSPGGSEPSTGTNYDVTYRYISTVTPQNIDLDAGQFTIAVSQEGGAATTVAGGLVLTDYVWKLPRIDRVALGRDGNFVKLKGRSNRSTPQPPSVPANLLGLATVNHDWVGIPEVSNDGVRAVSYARQQRLEGMVNDLFQLVALERLERDIASSEPSAKYGVFVDPFLDDDLRDVGTQQDGAIVGGVLMLPMLPTILASRQNDDADHMLPYNEEVVLEQTLATGYEEINPYQVFDAIGCSLSLNPAVDRWTENKFLYLWNPYWYYWYGWPYYWAWYWYGYYVWSWWTYRWYWWGWRWWYWGYGYANQRDEWEWFVSTLTNEDPRFRPWRRLRRAWWQLAEWEADRREIEYLRRITVTFTVAGFVGSESITLVKFGNVDVTPDPAPQADAGGNLTGSFVIPAEMPAGSYEVYVQGDQGTFGVATFFGQGEEALVVRIRNRPCPYWDPLAQTFRLEEGRQITSVDVQFAVIGDTANNVRCQIRRVELGVPVGTYVAEGELDMVGVSTSGWTKISFAQPVYLEAEVEYAIVLLTDDASHAVRLAQGGKLDATTGEIVTSQPYTVGVLLKSSNGTTWTPFQDQDLTFRLNAASYTSTEATTSLGPVALQEVVSITQTGGTATVTLPAGQNLFGAGQAIVIQGANEDDYNGPFTIATVDGDTFTIAVANDPASPATGTIYVTQGEISDLLCSATLELPTDECSVGFTYTLADSTTIDAGVDGRIQLESYLDQGITDLSMTLSGTSKLGPYVFAGVQPMLGHQMETATYVSRAFDAAASCRVRVTYEALLPGTSTVDVDALESDGTTWAEVASLSADAVGDGWTVHTHEIDPFANCGTTTKVRLTLNGSPKERPFVRNLRVVTT